MRRTQKSSFLNNEDFKLLHFIRTKIAFLKLWKIGGFETSIKNVKKMKAISCARSPNFWLTMGPQILSSAATDYKRELSSPSYKGHNSHKISSPVSPCGRKLYYPSSSSECLHLLQITLVWQK